MEAQTLDEQLEDVRQALIARVFERYGERDPHGFEEWLAAFRGPSLQDAEAKLAALESRMNI